MLFCLACFLRSAHSKAHTSTTSESKPNRSFGQMDRIPTCLSSPLGQARVGLWNEKGVPDISEVRQCVSASVRQCVSASVRQCVSASGSFAALTRFNKASGPFLTPGAVLSKRVRMFRRVSAQRCPYASTRLKKGDRPPQHPKVIPGTRVLWLNPHCGWTKPISHHPRNPDDAPVDTNKQWLQPRFQIGAGFRHPQ